MIHFVLHDAKDTVAVVVVEGVKAGMQLTANLAREILDAGAGGLHVYTHNNLDVTRDFLDRIGIDKGQQ